MKIQQDIYCGLLKMYDSFGTNEVEFSYQFNDESYKVLLEKYQLNYIAGRENDFQKARNIMNWLFSILIHDPDYHNKTEDNSIVLLDRLLNKKAINCRATATIMTECLLALKIPARSVWLMPFSPYDEDCHVVTMAYCKELSKWVMFDATVNSCVLNKEGVPLDPMEIRDNLKNMETLEFSDELWFYRIKCSHEMQKRGYYNYLAKNVFYFKSYKINGFNFESLKNQKIIYCLPSDFNFQKQIKILCKHQNTRLCKTVIPKKCSKKSFNLKIFE